MSFAENLKRIRKENGYSQEELAELLDVSRQAVGKWENGQGYPEVEKLLLLSKKLNVSLDELMETDFAARKEDKADKAVFSSEEQSPRRILISSPDGKTIANCYKFRSSPHFSTSKKAPKYALLGIDDKSFWGDNTNVLGWYAKEEYIRREIEEIHAAILQGETSYQLKYTVKVEYHWCTLRIVPDKKEQ